MARVVVVTGSDVGREALGEIVASDDELFVLVPAVERSRLDWLASDEGEAGERAARVAEDLRNELPAELAAVEVKPDRPGQLVLDAVAQHNPDLVVLALRRGEDATWLEEGELDAVPSSVNGVPVVQLEL